MSVLTQGNAAKLYCLQWLDRSVEQANGAPFAILDLGCGLGLNFVPLLKKYPHLRYVGIEPSPAACAQARIHLESFNADILQAYAYDMHQRVQERFDVVVSFSVLEHVYQRLRYLKTARGFLKPGGRFLINYDSGHFFSGKERLSNTLGPILARFGIERYYQSFVRECAFLDLVHQAGFAIEEQKVFNTALKGVYKLVPANHKEHFMQQWLQLELQLNDTGVVYDDAKAPYFSTRNFILSPM